MPKGAWKTPSLGKLASNPKASRLAARVYSRCRDANPAETPEAKAKCAKTMWAALKGAGYQPGGDALKLLGTSEFNFNKCPYIYGEDNRAIFYVNLLTDELTENETELIIPIIMTRQNVMNGCFKPNEEIANLNWYQEMKIFIDHPDHIKERSEEELQPYIGEVRNQKLEFDNNEQEMTFRGDAVFLKDRNDEQSLNDIKTKKIPISIEYWRDLEEASGMYKGKEYDHIERNIYVEDVAIMKNQKPACSIEDGCYIGTNQELNLEDIDTDKFNLNEVPWGSIKHTKENHPNKSDFIIQRGDIQSGWKLPYKVKGKIHCGGVRAASQRAPQVKGALTSQERARLNAARKSCGIGTDKPKGDSQTNSKIKPYEVRNLDFDKEANQIVDNLIRSNLNKEEDRENLVKTIVEAKSINSRIKQLKKISGELKEKQEELEKANKENEQMKPVYDSAMEVRKEKFEEMKKEIIEKVPEQEEQLKELNAEEHYDQVTNLKALIEQVTENNRKKPIGKKPIIKKGQNNDEEDPKKPEGRRGVDYMSTKDVSKTTNNWRNLGNPNDGMEVA